MAEINEKKNAQKQQNEKESIQLNSGQQGTKQFHSICHFIRSIHCLLMTFHALTHDVNQKLQWPLSMN